MQNAKRIYIGKHGKCKDQSDRGYEKLQPDM